jgi:hypothetical protein
VSTTVRCCTRISVACSLNRGIGIEVHKDIAAIQTFLQGKAAKLLSSISAQPAGANTYVLQKYIENPVRLSAFGAVLLTGISVLLHPVAGTRTEV